MVVKQQRYHKLIKITMVWKKTKFTTFIEHAYPWTKISVVPFLISRVFSSALFLDLLFHSQFIPQHSCSYRLFPIMYKQIFLAINMVQLHFPQTCVGPEAGSALLSENNPPLQPSLLGENKIFIPDTNTALLFERWDHSEEGDTPVTSFRHLDLNKSPYSSWQ